MVERNLCMYPRVQACLARAIPLYHRHLLVQGDQSFCWGKEQEHSS